MTHQMTLIGEHEGTEEWYCPTCGRRLLMEWDPFLKITLEPGDENAGHAGSKGGLSIGDIEVNRGLSACGNAQAGDEGQTNK